MKLIDKVFKMRKFLISILIILSLNSLADAEDPSDFEIEGVSIGISLLDFFTKDQLENEKNSEYTYVYENNKFMKIGMGKEKEFYLQKNINNYDDIGLIIKPEDNNYIVYGVQGRIFCDNGIDFCLSKQKEIISDMKKIFKNNATLDEYEIKHAADKSGNSMVYVNDFVFKNSKDIVGVTVYDWSDDITSQKEWYDSLKVDIFSLEYIKFLKEEAYN